MRKSAVLLILSLLVVLSFAQIPLKISFQGRLLDSLGNPIADGTYLITFRLYDVATGGTALWTEQHTVTTHNGLFNVMLGSIISLSGIDFGRPLWLGVQIGTEPELSPRYELGASPYALVAIKAGTANVANVANSVDWSDITGMPAGFADGVDDVGPGVTLIAGEGITISGDTISVADGGITEDKIANSAVTRLKIAPNAVDYDRIASGAVFTRHIHDTAVTGDKIAPMGASVGQVLKWNGTTWAPANDSVGGGGIGGGGTRNYIAKFTNAAGNEIGNSHIFENGYICAETTLVINSPTQVGLIYNGNDHDWASIYVNARRTTASPGYGYLRDSALVTHTYVDNNGAWRLDNGFTMTTKLIVDTLGRVGIGTTTPSHKLEVAGTTSTRGFRMPTGATAGYVLTCDASGYGRWQPAPGASPIALDDLTDVNAPSPADGQVLKYFATPGEWRPAPDETGTGGDGNDKVKADASDPTAGFLSNKVDNTTIEVNTATHQLRVKDGGITAAKLAAGIPISTFVNDSNYAPRSELADHNPATSPVSWSDLILIPPDIDDGDDLGITGTGMDNYLVRWVGTDSVEASIIYQDDLGRIGIGTITPSAKFEISAGAGLPGIKIKNAGISGLIINNCSDGIMMNNIGGNGIYIDSTSLSGIRLERISHDGIYIDSTGYAGINIHRTNGAGINIYDAGSHGIYIKRATNNGIRIDSTEYDGIYITRPHGAGIVISQTNLMGIQMHHISGIGVHIDSTGDDGLYMTKISDDGIQMSNISDDGIYMTDIGDDGIIIRKPHDNGILIYADSTTKYGMYIGDASGSGDPDTGIVIEDVGDMGIYMDLPSSVKSGLKIRQGTDISWAGWHGAIEVSTNSSRNGIIVEAKALSANGIIVDTAGYYGIRVHNTGNDGIYIGNTGDDGIYIGNTDNDGIYIGNTGDDGIYIASTGDDGIHLYNPGDDGIFIQQPKNEGIEIVCDDSTNRGIYIRNYFTHSADTGIVIRKVKRCGVCIDSITGTGGDGIIIKKPNDDGIQIAYTGDDAIWIISAGYWGIWIDSARYEGVRIERTGDDGVSILNPHNDGVYIWNPSEDGVDVRSPGDNCFECNGSGVSMFRVTASCEVFGHSFNHYIVEDGEGYSAPIPAATKRWLEHIGEAQTSGGICKVNLPEEFVNSTTINAQYPIQVFITPYGDMGNFWVERGTGYFVVHSQRDAKFAYRVVAVIKGFEQSSIEPVNLNELIDEEPEPPKKSD